MLTGWFLELERRIAALLGAAQGSDLTDAQQVHSTLVFVDVNTVLLGLCFLVAVWALLRTIPDRPWDAMMLAASPCVAAAALINWDLLAVALTALALMFWSRRRPGWAGVLLGLAIAAKLYPLFILGPLLLLCLRSARLRAFGVTDRRGGRVVECGESAGARAGAGGLAALLAVQRRTRPGPGLDLVRPRPSPATRSTTSTC